jgi:hypothetical protein
MSKKAKKAAAKKPKKAPAKKVAAKKPAPKAKPKKAKAPAKKKPAAKKAPAKKPVAKKVIAKQKPAPKPVAKAPAPKPAPKKVVPAPAKAAPVKMVAKAMPGKSSSPKPKPDIKALLKSGLKLLPKPLPSEIKEEKRPKELYNLEYMINSSPDILFDFISSAAGLEKWFAEKVNVKDNVFTFYWDNDEQKQARLIALKEREFARFHWLDQPDKRYFEFRIQIDDLTGEVALLVSDFADSQTELEDARLLWNAQVHDLLHALGSP